MRNTKRSANILIRTTPDEKSTIQAKAQAVGLTVSDFIRHIALTYQIPEQERDNPSQEEAAV